MADYDIQIKGGTIVDGTGGGARPGSTAPDGNLNTSTEHSACAVGQYEGRTTSSISRCRRSE